MNEIACLSHSVWECKSHVVWIPKHCEKASYGQVRKYLDDVFRNLVRNRQCEMLEGHLMPDHGHMRVSIPPN